MMKKTVAILLTLTLMLTLFAACANGPASTTDENVSADAASTDAAAPENTDATDEETPQPSEQRAVKNPNFSDLTDFSAGTLDGGTFTAADFAGRDLTVINIWATFCGPCLSEMADLAAFEKTLPENVRLITLCTDAHGQKDTVQSILDEAGYTGVTLVSFDGDLNDLLNDVLYVPTTLFFDENGVCVGTEMIGAQDDFAAAYTEAINNTLALLGKETI